MHFRSAVTSSLAARDQKDRLTDSKLDEVQGRAHVANNLSDAAQSRSHGHYCACSLVLPIFRNLWHQSAEKRSEPIFSLHTHSLGRHLPTHTLLHCPFSQEADFGLIFGRTALLDEEHFLSLHCCLSYNMLLQMSECFVGIIIYSKCNTQKKCKIASQIPGDKFP